MLNLLTFTYRIIWNLTLLTSIGLLAHGCNSTAPDSATSPAPMMEKPEASTAPQTAQTPTPTSVQKPVTKTTTETTAKTPAPTASPKSKMTAKGEVSCPKATPVAYFETHIPLVEEE